MMKQWINQSGNPGLLIFFNGWGMDAKPFARLDATGLDVLMIYDYSNLDMPVDLDALAGQYSSCRLTAWSLGVCVLVTALYLSWRRISQLPMREYVSVRAPRRAREGRPAA